MVEVIAKVADLPLLKQPADAFEAPMKRKETLIVGGTHLLPMATLFPRYAVNTSILIPQDIPGLDREIEMGRAIQFEDTMNGACRSAGFARDLSGVDSDSVDVLILCSIYPATRDDFLAQAWRVVREFGKVVVFTNSEIPLTHLVSFGLAAPAYYPTEGFYVGTMRKAKSIRARN